MESLSIILWLDNQLFWSSNAGVYFASIFFLFFFFSCNFFPLPDFHLLQVQVFFVVVIEVGEKVLGHFFLIF